MKLLALLIGGLLGALVAAAVHVAIRLYVRPAAAATVCLTFKEARAAHPKAFLRYRVVSPRQCWYAPGAAPNNKVNPAAGLEGAKAALCGGPCPRFDLQDPVFVALCGGPCPDFRRIKSPIALNP